MQIYVADRVWDGVSATCVERGFVRISDGTIDAAGRAADLPSGTDVRDFGDATILPGLINAHVHLTFSATPTVLADHLREKEEGFEALMARAKDNLRRAIDSGVTTIRDLGTLNDVVFACRSAVRDGSLLGPDVVAAGEGITSLRGHCHFFGIECEGEAGVRDAVKRQHDAGADVIKIFATGGNLTPGTDPLAPQFTVEEVRGAVQEARAAGLLITAHAHATEGIRRATAARVDSIEHCSFDGPVGVDFNEQDGSAIADAGIVAVPTLGSNALDLLNNPERIEEVPEDRRENVRRLLKAMPHRMLVFKRMRELGVEFITGTDAGIPGRPFDGFAKDLGMYSDDVGIGLGPLATLRAATSECALKIGLDDRGVLSAGKRADVLVVGGDPLQRIEDLQRTLFVTAAGRVVLGAG